MSAPIWHLLVTAIHARKQQTVLAITGGGSQAIGRLLEVPGGSQTVLEAIVPYSSAALADWLGSAAEQSCSRKTACAMAMASWIRARNLSPETDPSQLLGVGATASLTSDRPKRGEQRVHAAMQTASTTATYSLIFAKGQRDRPSEEALAAEVVLLGLAETCKVDVADVHRDFQQRLQVGEQIEFFKEQAEVEWTELLLGQRSHVCYPKPFAPEVLFPGAFNPPHLGHKRIADLAAARLGSPVAYELSITNVDKPPLDFVEIGERLKLLRGKTASENILLTDAPTFRVKAALFPGCTFVVGADTIARIADPKYYSGDAGTFEAAIGRIAAAGCRFLVFGREINGDFGVLSDLALPSELRKLCDEVSAQEFREDVSSTQLRV